LGSRLISVSISGIVSFVRRRKHRHYLAVRGPERQYATCKSRRKEKSARGGSWARTQAKPLTC
jgi:hypothetical protein